MRWRAFAEVCPSSALSRARLFFWTSACLLHLCPRASAGGGLYVDMS